MSEPRGSALFEPFEGVRFASRELTPHLCPPYDVIGPALAAKLRRKPHNAIHLELPEEHEGAARLWRAWLAEGVLARDASPAFYLVEQRFGGRLSSSPGERRHGGAPAPPAGRRRVGLLGALRLEAPGGAVLPHERTFAKPRRERMKLLRALEANTSPVFGSFADPRGALRAALEAAGEPSAFGTAPDGSEYRLHRLDDTYAVEALRRAVDASRVLIADGHHRYRVALEFGRRSRLPGAGRALAYLAADDDPDLVVLPTHRVVASKALPMERVERFCRVSERPSLEALESSLGGLTFGLVVRRGGRLARLFCEPKPKAAASSRFRPVLDVEWVQSALLKKAPAEYVHEAARAESMVKASKGKLAVLLGPLSVPRIRAAVDANGLLPQKSTYFHPKIATGLVFRSLS